MSTVGCAPGDHTQTVRKPTANSHQPAATLYAILCRLFKYASNATLND